VILAHRIELDPTEKQKAYFRQACGTARFVWNWALAEWNDRYEVGANPDACQIKRYFNSFEYEAFPWLKNIHRDAHAQPFAALGKAWKAYLNGEVEGRPRFKKKEKCRDSFYVASDKFSSRGKTVRLPIIGQVKLRESLRFTGKMQSATVSREADRWFIAMAVEIPEREVQPLGVREWRCPACQTTHDRDMNAAINLKQNTVGYHGNRRLGTGRLWLGWHSQ